MSAVSTMVRELTKRNGGGEERVKLRKWDRERIGVRVDEFI